MGHRIKGYLPIFQGAKYLNWMDHIKWYRFDGKNSFPYGQITPNTVTHPYYGLLNEDTLKSHFVK